MWCKEGHTVSQQPDLPNSPGFAAVPLTGWLHSTGVLGGAGLKWKWPGIRRIAFAYSSHSHLNTCSNSRHTGSDPLQKCELAVLTWLSGKVKVLKPFICPGDLYI